MRRAVRSTVDRAAQGITRTKAIIEEAICRSTMGGRVTTMMRTAWAKKVIKYDQSIYQSIYLYGVNMCG
jgi:hypothetical protein